MTPRWHSLATSAAWGGARSVLRSTAMPARPLEVETSVEGMAARIVEAERAGAEDPHQDRAGCRGALEMKPIMTVHMKNRRGDRSRRARGSGSASRARGAV